MNKVSHIDLLYEEGNVFQKREIISSIYPENLTFDGSEYRTFHLNEALRLICSVDKGFREIKKEKISDFSQMSARVSPNIQISNYFLEDLKRLADLFRAVA
jgi:site-specific DNA recombinase